MVRCTKTGCLTGVRILTLLCSSTNVGISLGILGPTLVDLAQYTGVSLPTACTILTWCWFSSLLACVVGGVLLDRVEGYLCLGAASLLQAVMLAIAPWFTNLVLMGVFQAIAHYFMTTVLIGVTCLVFQLELFIARPTIYASTLAMNTGRIMAPFIAAPFLSKPGNNRTGDFPPPSAPFTVLRANCSGGREEDHHLASDMTDSHVGRAYLLIAGYSLLSSTLFFIVAIAKGCHCKQDVAVRNANDEIVNGHPKLSGCRLATALLVFCVIVVVQSGLEVVDTDLLVPVVSEFMTRNTVLLMLAVYQGSKVLVCIGTMFVIRRAHPALLLMLDLALMLAAGAAWSAAMAFSSPTMLWTGLICLSLGRANFQATLFVWLQMYIPIGGKISSVVFLLLGDSDMITPPLATWLLDLYGPTTLPVYVSIFSALSALFIFSLRVVLKEKCCSFGSPTFTECHEEEEGQRLISENNDEKFIFYNQSSDWSDSEEWKVLGKGNI